MAKFSLSPDQRRTVTDERLIDELARRVMNWKPGPDRFVKSGRSWIPRWRFQPAEKLEDALRLLETAAPEDYSMRGDGRGNFSVRVRIGDTTGEATGVSKPRAITLAIARALGIDEETDA